MFHPWLKDLRRRGTVTSRRSPSPLNAQIPTVYEMRIAAVALAASVLLMAGCGAGQEAGPSPTGKATTSKPKSRKSPTSGPVATPAASPEGWEYAYIDERQGSRITGITAAGPKEAWAAGTVGKRLLLLHHDGTGWHEVDPPPGVPEIPEVGEVYVGASGPDDVWLLLPETPPGQKHPRSLTALRWDGAAWRPVPGRIDSSHVSGFRVFGPSEAWAVFGPTSEEAVHWDGSAWAKVPLPAKAEALGGSPGTGLWAVGFRMSGPGITVSEGAQPAVMRWDGRSWRLLASTPTYAFPRPKPPEGTATLESVLVLGRNDVWVSGTHTFNHGETENEPADPPPILLHWDGRSWSRKDVTDGRPTCCLVLAEGPSGSALALRDSQGLRGTWRFASPGEAPVKVAELPPVPGVKGSQWLKVMGTARTDATWVAGTLLSNPFFQRAAIAALR